MQDSLQNMTNNLNIKFRAFISIDEFNLTQLINTNIS